MNAGVPLDAHHTGPTALGGGGGGEALLILRSQCGSGQMCYAKPTVSFVVHDRHSMLWVVNSLDVVT